MKDHKLREMLLESGVLRKNHEGDLYPDTNPHYKYLVNDIERKVNLILKHLKLEYTEEPRLDAKSN